MDRFVKLVGEENVMKCFTDGACIHNGKHNAKASYAVVWPDHEDMNIANLLEGSMQTNNRAEYTGIITALEQAELLDPEHKKTLVVYTDSMLVIKSMTEWLHGWKKKGWKKADGSPVMNLDLVQELEVRMQTRKTVFKHVRAHTGGKDYESVWNDKADRMASDMLERC